MAAIVSRSSLPPLAPETARLTSVTTPSPVTPTFLGPPITISPTSTSTSTVPASTPHYTPVVFQMREKVDPTDSETALVGPQTTERLGNNTSDRPGAIQNLSRRLSGKGATSPETNQPTAEPMKEKEKVVSTATPAPIAPPSNASTTTSAAPSKPNTSAKPAASSSIVKPTATHKAAQKKRRKRKGLAGLFVALGCLSAGQFEEEEKATPVGGNQMAQKPGADSGATQVTKPDAASGPSTRPVDTVPFLQSSQQADATGTTSTANTGSSMSGGQADTSKRVVNTEEIQPEAVIVAPVDPVTLPDDETAGVTSSAVQPPGSGSTVLSTPLRTTAARRESESGPAENERTETSGGYSNISDSEAVDESSGQTSEEHGEDYPMDEEYEDEEDRLIAQGGMGIPLDQHGQPAPLLPVMDKVHEGRKCLVLDLDETLLHSSFKMLPSADYIVPVEIESQTHNVYVIKRPGVDHFLKEMGKIYEVVIFTASLSKYADPVLDMLDVHRVVRHRLFRESCYNHKGNYVKDLSQLGREMETSIIIDNSPASYIFHPNNAVPVSTWFNDPHDTELTDLCPFLADLATVDDIRGVLDGSI